MKRSALALLLAAASLASSGCLVTSIVISIKPDGSGTIAYDQLVLPQSGQPIPALEAMGKLPNEEGLRKAVGEFGTGVTLVSYETASTADGRGFKARLAFDDINHLWLSGSAGLPSVGEDPIPSAVGPLKARLLFTREGSKSVLRIPKMLDLASLSVPPSAPARPPVSADEPSSPMTQQILDGAKGARSTIAIEIDGRILTSNAPAEMVTGSRILLYDADVDKILADREWVAKLRSSGGSIANALRAGLPAGFRILQTEVVVEFVAK